MTHAVYSENIISAGIGRASNLSKNLFINNVDLEFLILRWSTESHTFVIAWSELCPTLEDVVVLTGHPVFGESKAIKTLESSDGALDAEGKVRLVLLTEALSDSSTKIKANYMAWVTYFTQGSGAGSEIVLKLCLLTRCLGMFCLMGPKSESTLM